MKASCEKWLKEQFGDDAETIGAIYAEYLETLADLSGRFAAARTGNDASELDRVLHTIKGSAAMAGDTELSELAQRARGTDDAGLLDNVAELMRRSMSDNTCES